jgi:starvation-inducible outer membrane lipoprotein
MTRTTTTHHARLAILILLLALFAAACKKLPTPLPETPQATIEISEIVDKTSLEPIAHNTITLRWETSAGKLIETQEFQDQPNLVTTLPADGTTRLIITIEAQGYATWSNNFQMKLEKDQTLSTPVELQRKANTQS